MPILAVPTGMEDRGADVAGGLGERGVVVADRGPGRIFLRPEGLQRRLAHQAAGDADGVGGDAAVLVGREIVGRDDRLGGGIGRAQPDRAARGRAQVAGADRDRREAMQRLAELVERQRLDVELDVGRSCSGEELVKMPSCEGAMVSGPSGTARIRRPSGARPTSE